MPHHSILPYSVSCEFEKSVQIVGLGLALINGRPCVLDTARVVLNAMAKMTIKVKAGDLDARTLLLNATIVKTTSPTFNAPSEL